MEIFGTGGGETVAESLTRLTGAPVPLLGQIPLEPRVRESGDEGRPIVLAAPDAPAAEALASVAGKLAVRRESLAGRPLGLRPAARG
jgi:ATP-binding protein involved in chromosome partitioning